MTTRLMLERIRQRTVLQTRLPQRGETDAERMKWTTELPPSEEKSDGKFYWFKGTIGEHKFVEPTIVQLFYNETNFNAKLLEVTMWPAISSSKGQWARPLDLPED